MYRPYLNFARFCPHFVCVHVHAHVGLSDFIVYIGVTMSTVRMQNAELFHHKGTPPMLALHSYILPQGQILLVPPDPKVS